MLRSSHYALLVITAAATLLTAGCNKATPPNDPTAPYGSAAGGTGVTYGFLSSVVDPGGDSVAIRFDWDDGDTSDWSTPMASGDTATAGHAWADTGTYGVRAQARNTSGSVSDWSSARTVTITPAWSRTFGGPADDAGASVCQTSDGDYLICGYTFSYGYGENVYLVRVSPMGDTLWTRNYGDASVDYGTSAMPAADGGFIVTGKAGGTGDGDQVYLAKTNANGFPVWTQFFGYSNQNEYGSEAQQTSDGGYITAGWTSADNGDFFIVKTGADGGTQWYTDKGYDNSVEYCYSIHQTADGGYILTGMTNQHEASGDVWLLKIGADGGTDWYKHFGGDQGEAGQSVRQTSDGGYIIAGTTASYGAGGTDAFLTKTDANGVAQWTREFGGTADDAAAAVRQTTDGGFIVVGKTQSYGAGKADVYLIKTDGEGNQQWFRTYGGPDTDEGTSVQLTADGGYVIGGCTKSFGADGMDCYVIKTDAQGNCAP